jgi:hypothetical protein
MDTMQPRHIRETSWYVVYECVDAQGVRLYIGMSIESNFTQRLAAHRGKPWWPRVARVITTQVFSRSCALTIEAGMIEKHQPEGNFFHTERAKRAPMPPIVSSANA